MSGNNRQLILSTGLLAIAAPWIIALSPGASAQVDPATASSVQNPPEIEGSAAPGDSSVTSRVKIRLLGDESLAGSAIDVSTKEGVVRLKGIVQSAKVADEAVRVASAVEGVKAVDNQLTVKPSATRVAERSTGSPSLEESGAADNRINLKVRNKLLSDEGLKNTQIGISTIDGVVRLFGEVQSAAQKDLAARIAGQTEGVQGVDSSALAIVNSQ